MLASQAALVDANTGSHDFFASCGFFRFLPVSSRSPATGDGESMVTKELPALLLTEGVLVSASVRQPE